MPHKVQIQLLDDVDSSAIGNLKILQFDSTSGKHKYVTPASTIGGITGFATPAIVLGTAAAAGSATTVIRSDSTIVAFDSTVPSTQAVGDSASTGSIAFSARRDHKHAITNPLTTKGDVWVGGVSGAPSRLPVGSDNQVLTADSAQTLGVKWATPATGFADPTTTKGDLIVHGTSTTRLGVGSDGQVLTADSTQTLGVKWASGAVSPLTTKGDVWGYSSVDARIPIGSDGQVLTADSAQTLGLKWATSSGATYYSASSQADTAVTDNASFTDLNALSISSVAAGTYLAVVDFVGNNKTGEVRVQITDGSGTAFWPTGNNWDSRHNTDNNLEFSHSGLIVVGSTSTVKVRVAAVASVSNWHVYDRHITLVKVA